MKNRNAVLCLAVLGLCQLTAAFGDRFAGLRDRVLNGQNNNGQNDPTTTTAEPASGRIIGGPPVVNHCTAPFNSMVALQVDAGSSTKLTYCTGTLVSPDTVVTAALCLIPFQDFPADVVKVIVGDRELNLPDRGEQMLSIDSFVIHPEFDGISGDNNIAVVKLRTPAVLGPCVQPMERYTSMPDVCESSIMTCRIAGWGAYSVDTAVNNSQPARYGDIRVFDDTFTRLVQSTKYQGLVSGPSAIMIPLPVHSVIGEAFEGSRIAACIYDWGSMVACNMGGTYKLRGVVANANCDIASLLVGTSASQIPMYITKIDSYQSWLDVCIANYANCATAM
ncbi:hypothetical protein BaRGS_00004156 [Batillaria attramentaria]|uniref:Peptidase S1 domain-containing protein n=1 Tax=Batillaria attramentaria TaxID=370345 RepID=A0ABD0LYQ7_9CAEN